MRKTRFKKKKGTIMNNAARRTGRKEHVNLRKKGESSLEREKSLGGRSVIMELS